MAPFTALPEPPYYAVIFSSSRTATDEESYEQTAQRMAELAAAIPGYLGIESARGADGFGITVSYWSSEEAIATWKAQIDHRAAQAQGQARWYAHYELRIAMN